MRLIASFLIGLLSFFYLGELINRIFKRPLHSIFGLSLILIGFLMGFFGHLIVSTPLDVFIATFLLGAGCGLVGHHLLSQQYIIHERAEKQFLKKHENLITRIIEILPGAMTWLALTSPFWLSFTLPLTVAYLIIIADVYWLISAIRISVLIIVGYKKMEWAKKQPWLINLKKDFPLEWQDYYQLLALPVYKESLEVLGPAFDAVVNSNFPKNKIFLVVGFEERVNPKELHSETIKYLNSLNDKIGGVIITYHPEGLHGEIAGPGTNRNWMINRAQEYLKKNKIDPKQVLATTLDADFVIHPEFLSGALHKYLSTPENLRDKRSYTGVFLYHNNYWQAPTPMRLIATGTSFWQLAEMVGSDKYMNYSSLSINMQSLLDIGLWIPDKVNDDSGFYWKAFFHFKGDYKVIPHFMPISADTVLDVTLAKTFQNQYLQLKRWAYGVEHLPYIFKQYFRRTDIDFWAKTDRLAFTLWANLKWGTLALFVTFAGMLIPLINPHYKESVLAVNLPIISSYIMTAAFIGLFVTIYVHEKTSPPRPKNWGLLQRLWSYIQFLLVPIVVVTISTIPAIDAQTTLMFGKHIKYRTTNKARIST